MKALLPTLPGFPESLLDDVAENPEQARRAKAGDHTHQNFVGERALHLGSKNKQIPCRASCGKNATRILSLLTAGARSAGEDF
ncbi:MAG: hypothetical protein K8R23_13480 [Chthoniobacter sp.]|nr:hypothetical protein [Chthoniobacter sp.]